MIRRLTINKYRKLKDIEITFSKEINVISGTNGTCKTSLLHIVSNSFQKMNKSCEWVKDSSCLTLINKINKSINPKIESLTKGDKTYNDPAIGHAGTLFSVDYYGMEGLEFRRHNSSSEDIYRYSVKPLYRTGSQDRLPYCPVIYLGLARLFAFGEFQDDSAVQELREGLPESYQTEIMQLYKELTGISISTLATQKMGDIKTRMDFGSNSPGIDSNTISAGEDNILIIITAIVSLKYYFESINSTRDVESILLIDEIDATLHPSLQFGLLDLLRKYSIDYKIQIIFTTHSLSLLEYALKRKDNVIYLIDNITNIIKMESPDIYKIKMFLHDITRDNIYLNKAIPVFTEDDEARLFINILFDYFQDKEPDFLKVRRNFHLVEVNIGSNNLIDIFNDSYLLNSTMRSICILDGDQDSDYTKYIITLPGGKSPEEMIMDYSRILFDNDDSFWVDETILDLNYGKVTYRNNILPDIEEITDKIKELKNDGKSTRGVRRSKNKEVFNKHKRFFELLFKHWVNNDEYSEQVERFYKDLNIMFKKVAEFHGINPNDWNIN